MSLLTENKTKQITTSLFCKQLPKIELHAHLNGSLNEETLKKLGCTDSSVSDYQKLSEVFEKNDRTLQECFALFGIAHKATNTKEKLYVATKSVIEDFDKDNTYYLEIRTTPRNEEGMTKEEYIETVINAIRDCENTCSIIVKLILSINRNENKKTSEDSLDIILKLKNKYPDVITGIDLSGNPEVGTFDEKLFERARKGGLKTAIHCAEVKNDEEVRKILNFVPDRIGHGVYLHPLYGGSQENWDLYCQKRIPTECCLTSNVTCGIVPKYERHHIQEWIKEALPFSICTDDKGVFCTNLSKEYEHVMRCFNLSASDMYRYNLDALYQSFASTEDIRKVENKLSQWFLRYEQLITAEAKNVNYDSERYILEFLS